MHKLPYFRSLLAITLLLAGLLGTGCTTTKTVKSDGSPHRAEINKEAEGNTAKVTLRSTEQLKLKNFRIDADSVSGVSEVHSVSLPVSRVEKVKIGNRSNTALKWSGINIAAWTALGLLDGFAIDDGYAWHEDTLGGVLVGVLSSLVVGPLAAIGSEDLYKFEKDPSFRDPSFPAENKERVVARQKSNSSSKTPSSDAKETATRKGTGAASVVDSEIPRTDMKRPDDIAIVIGNTEYKNGDIPKVDYAVRDARIMKKYLTRTLGFREENVIYVENASGSSMTRIFGTSDDPKGQLYDWVKSNQSSVFVYYSGHGAPNPETGNAYLLPSDANPSYLSQNGYPLTQLYENLSKLPAQSVTVALEACFSGTSEGGAVVQNASPAVLSVENPMLGMKNGLVFTAGAADQIASWYNEKKHGLFTYYFLKGLRGKADANSDKEITANEMESYLNDKVPYRAQRMHSRKQTPQVVGQNKDNVLIEYEE